MRRLHAMLVGAALFLGTGLAAQDDADSYREIVASPDRLTEEALRAAFLGDDERLQRLVWETEIFERHNVRQGEDFKTLRENVAALAAARQRPLPTASQVDAPLEDKYYDAELDAMVRLVEKTEPRDKLRTARDARRYDNWRRRVNSVTNAVTGVFSLQFFPLLQVPLDVLDYALNGRHYLSPEERRELYAARVVLETPGLDDAEKEKARETVAAWTGKRRATAMLQARRNAQEAERANRLEAANWWYEREMLLAQATEPFRDEHRAIRNTLREQAALRARLLTVADGEDFLREPAHFAAYGELLRDLLLDFESVETVTAVQDYRVAMPLSPVIAETRIIEAARERALGNDKLAEMNLNQAAREESAVWKQRAHDYAARADFNPAAAFDEAHAAITRRGWSYVLAGRDPRRSERHLSAEEARQIESGWIQGARSLWLFDIIGRAITFPLQPSTAFPREELFAAYRTAPREFLATPEGRAETRSTAAALRRSQRYEEAARLYEKLNDTGRAAAMREKAARALLRESDAEPEPLDRLEALQRLLNAYPGTRSAEKAREQLEQARANMQVIANLTPREMDIYPELWRHQGLNLSATIRDGKKSNGEVDRTGLRLMTGGRIAYTDRQTGEEIVLPVDEETVERVARELLPRRRIRMIDEKLDEPRERKRIPVAIEGGAFPGFGISPGLVPLDPDPAERRLYE
ncbi:MAG: hypothetical protein PWP23_2862 [Candidatus Sumerlaeota bacterium]|nr:hypothetical protein [Candidatus Sumerlaeota bacterium]